MVLTGAPECYIMFFRLVNMSVLLLYIGCVPARWLEFLAVGAGGAVSASWLMASCLSAFLPTCAHWVYHICFPLCFYVR